MRISTLSLVTVALLTAAVSLGAAGAGGGAPPAATAPGARGAGGPGGPGGGRGAGRGGAPAGPATPVPDGDKSKRIDVIDFGTTRDGAANKLFILRNHKGNALKVMTYGATMQAIEMPDKDGKVINCLLSSGGTFNQGFGNLAYTVGPVANRIAGAKFTLEGKEYTLEANNAPNTLHSGSANFGTRLWEGKALPEKPTETSAEFTITNKDGNAGFPGNINAKITFTLTDDNEVRLDYEGTTDKTTLFAPTNHAYFNLSGSGSVMDDELWIDADNVTAAPPAARGGAIPFGEVQPVAGTPYDFTKPGTKVGSRNNGGYDLNFVINNWQPGKGPGGGAKGPVLIARVTDPN